jgi:outer membrane protein OmpA-like peptidoglycan-associated protein
MTLLTMTLALAVAGAGPGTAVFPFIKLGQGPRASAMGEAFAALADDASAIYWNPAGLGRVAGTQLALSHQQWFADIKDEVLHAALPLGPGALGFGLVYTGEPDVLYWNADEQKFESFTAWNSVLTAGYGVRLGENYRVGASLTGLYQDLKFEQGIGGAVDLGAFGEPFAGLGLGLAARHLGVVSYAGGQEKLPVEIAAGASFATGPVRLTLDGVFPVLDNTPSVRGGVEFAPIDLFALRVGYRSGPVDLSGLGYLSGLTGGIGFSVGNFGIDYAIAPYGELGLTHRIGIRTIIPPPEFGAWTVTVLDRESGQKLAATLAFGGVADTTLVTDEVTLRRLAPGRADVRAAATGYAPGTGTFTVVAGRTGRDTVRLQRLRAAIRGGIYDAKTNEPIGGTLGYTGPAAAEIAVAADPGTYHLTDVAPGRFVLNAAGPSELYEAQTCTLDVALGATAVQDFYLWRRGDFLVLEGINFETGKADILPEFRPILERAGRILRQTPTVRKVELAGHTDPRPIKTPEFPSNRELSQARAEAVRQDLIDNYGIDPARLTAKGYADTQPVATNATEEGMAKNRRTELRIIE